MDINENEKINTPQIAEGDESTIEVTQQDIDSELLRYGVYTDEEETVSQEIEPEPEKKKFPVQKTIIIAAIAFVLVSVFVLAIVPIYNTFFKPGLSGVWVLEGAEDIGVYYVFDKDGNITIDQGGIKQVFTYTYEEREDDDALYVLTPLFSSSDFVAVTYGDNKDTMIITLGEQSINFFRSELPEYELDSSDITHASADELGVDSLKVDNALLGTWQSEVDEWSAMFGYPQSTLEFSEDGYFTWTDDYTSTQGFLHVRDCKYSVTDDNKVLVSTESYAAGAIDEVFEYSMDGDSLIFMGVKYNRVEDTK